MSSESLAMELRALISELHALRHACPGDPYYSTSDSSGGHGEAGLEPSYKDALGQWEAPKGFRFVTDAECTTIAMMRDDEARQMAGYLNRVLDALDRAERLAGAVLEVSDGQA